MSLKKQADDYVELFYWLVDDHGDSLSANANRLTNAIKVAVIYVDGLMKEDDRINHPVASERYETNSQILSELKSRL